MATNVPKSNTDCVQDDEITTFERNQTITKIIGVLSQMGLSEGSETLQYNLALQAKWIEDNIYKKANKKCEYDQLLAEGINKIQAEVKDKKHQLSELTRQYGRFSLQMWRYTSSYDREWRYFYSQALRMAVVNAFMKDLRSKVEIPTRNAFGVRVGAESVENVVFEKARSKADYFRTLEAKKTEMIGQLISYFGNGN